MSGVEAVLFDLDGTLVNTPPAIATALRKAVAETTGEELDLPSILPLVGRPLSALCAVLVNRDEDDPATAAAVLAYQDHYRRDIVPHARELLFPGVAEGIAALASEAKRLAVVTSKNHAAAELLLDSAQLLSFFDLVIGADDVRFPKPAAEAGHRALELLCVDRRSAVMVGDTADDVAMAAAIPMRSIGVTYGATGAAAMAALKPTFIAHDFPAVAYALAVDSMANDEVHS